MSAPIERNPHPNAFRDQYAGGLKEDEQVQAALNGASPVESSTQQSATNPRPSQFGPMVKLR